MEGETDTDSSESENEEDMKRGVKGGIPYDVRRIGGEMWGGGGPRGYGEEGVV